MYTRIEKTAGDMRGLNADRVRRAGREGEARMLDLWWQEKKPKAMPGE